MRLIRLFFLKPWIYILIVLTGTLLKFYQLNSKLFWADEIATVLYTSGIKDLRDSIPVNQVKSVGYYDSILHLGTSPRSLKDEWTGIFSNTHLTPGHYALLTLWYRVAGDNDLDYRLFSVFIFILSLPFTFLLSKMLFSSNLGGWIALSLYAVSPMIHFEAQEARYYILWVFFFILSNYLFLQSIKQNKTAWWVGYSLAAIFALYTSIGSVGFIFGHLLFILLFKKALRVQFLISLLLIALAYSPWLYYLVTVRDTIENGLAWHKRPVSPYLSIDLLFFQFLGFVRSFAYLFDSKLYWSWLAGTTLPGIYTAIFTDLVLLTFIIYSIVYILRKTSKEIRWFAILIILPWLLILYLSDIARNGFTSILWRYQIVNIAGITLVVTNLLKDKIAGGKLFFISVYLLLVFAGLASIWKTATNQCWNTSPDCESNIGEARLIAAAAHPLIITDCSGFGMDRFLAVLNASKAANADIMYCKGTIPNLQEKIAGKGYSEIYILKASDSLALQLKSQFGNTMLACRKEQDGPFEQVWKIRLDQ